MFKYSKLWLEKIANEKIDIEDFDKNWLDLQGFEVATETPMGDDIVVELEVKANRPDMLSHLGVLREYYVYKNKGVLPNINSKLTLSENTKMPIDVRIETNDCDHLLLLNLEGVDNTKETPKELKMYLENLGVNSINPIVDISNIIMLQMGQPIHIFDADKVKKCLVYKNADDNTTITTLKGDELKVSKGSIVISDDEGVTCLAGMIGAKRVEVDENTKNIIIESAHFKDIPLRKTTQSMHITTLASYRFERGVDSDNMINSGLLCAEMIMDICGGKLVSNFVKNEIKKPNEFVISASKTNKLLGTKISSQGVADLLNKYYFTCKALDEDKVQVITPSYRMDLEEEIDIVGDIAQMYGYHNIEPTTPELLVKYEPNHVYIVSEQLRKLLTSQGVNECISYSFIHKDVNKMLSLTEKDDIYNAIEIINPLSIKFGVMRSSMVYSMINTYIYNITKNNECEPIFDIGSVFFKGDTDTGYAQKTSVGVLLNGVKISKGFGIDKELNYDFYDIKQILGLISSEFSMDITLKVSNRPFMEENKSVDIIYNDKLIGFMGVISPNNLNNFENGKLIKGEVLYLELYVDDLVIGSTPIEEVSKYPSIVREYNFLVPADAVFDNYSSDIKKLSEYIRNIKVNDIYKGKGVKEGYISVLLEIEYLSFEKTLLTEEVEDIEKNMYAMLKKQDIELKL